MYFEMTDVHNASLFALVTVDREDLTMENRMDLYHDSNPVPTSDTILLVLKPLIKGTY